MTRGYALLMVMVILVMCAAAIALLTMEITTVIQAGRRARGTLNASYVAEGIARLLEMRLTPVLTQTSPPTLTQVQDAICTPVSDCPTTQLDEGAGRISITGPGFASLAAHSTENTRTRVRVIVPEPPTTIASGPFQGVEALKRSVELDVLIRDTSKDGATELATRATWSRTVLGAFPLLSFAQRTLWAPTGARRALGGPIHATRDLCLGGSVELEVVSAGSTLRHASRSSCGGLSSGDPPFPAGVGPFSVALDGESPSWLTAATSTYHSRALDESLGVNRASIAGAIDAVVQRQVSNSGTIRGLVDPVYPSDTATVRDMKIAHRADIRILDGVWYLKNPSNPRDWPGVPIWSDHAGVVTSQFPEDEAAFLALPANVGQESLRLARAWGAATPRLFSRYEADAAAQVADDGNGAISYGSIGVQAGAHAAAHVTNAGFAAVAPGDAYAAINGSRSGFIDHATGENILPVNLNVAALAAALASTDPGELGSYFGAGLFMGRPFNGAVWIGSLWPGSLNGTPFRNPGEAPVPAPTHTPIGGSLADGRDNDVAYPLCSVNPTAHGNGNLAAPGEPPLHARLCNGIGSNSYVNGVRIINGADLGAFAALGGLTIGTNLPMYVVGNVNTGVTVVPTALAADRLVFLSTGYTDAVNGWTAPTAPAVAGAGGVVHAMLIGGSALGALSDVETLFVGIEDSAAATLRGPLILGFTAVYHTGNRTPAVVWEYDPSYLQFARQPPGVPLVTLDARRHVRSL